MSAVATEDIELENILQQVFMECDASMSVSTPDSMVSVGEEMPISRIIEYILDQLPTWSIDNLMELWKCLIAVSTNGRVNFHQFKEATQCWIAKMQQIQSSQDGNNNARETLPLVSDTDSSMKTVDVNGHIMEFELRVKLRELHEENILLRDELERHEGSIDNLKQQCGTAEKQLDRYIKRCHQLEKENDEQKDQLNEAIEKEKAITLALQKFTKEHQNMMKQLEVAEIEVQAIPSLKDKMDKINREKLDCIKQIAKLQDAFDEKEDECKQLKVSVTELENTNINMREMYEYTIRNLREKNRQLLDENTELQSLSALNGCPSGEQLSMSSISDTDGCYTHSTPCKVEKVQLQDSLYAELKALGFTAECKKYPRLQELEEELDEYDTAISMILEQLEKIIRIFATIRGSTYDISQFNLQDTDPRTYNVEALKHKVAFLLNVATEEITRRQTKDSSTQLRADPTNAIDDLTQFGVRNFRDLPTCTRPYPKAETDLRSITSHSVNNNKVDHDDDIFLRVIKTYTSIPNRFRIIEPIIEELHYIIESTISTLSNRKDCSSSGNSRYRSIHTLPSSTQSPQPSSLITENSRQWIFNYQSPTTNSLDVSLARGDSLMRERFDKKSAPFATATHNISDQEDLARLEGNRSSDMSKVSNVLQINSKALVTSEEEKTRTKSFQVPVVSSASNPASPRRKISVYCRSFDVVAVQDSREDNQGSNLEVRRSLSNPGDLPALLDQKIDETDRNSTFKYPSNHCYRNTNNDSDSSSNNSTPQKQNSLLDDEPPVEQSVLRKVYLAPTRLRFPQEVKSELNRTADASDYASPVADSTATDISNSLLSSIVDSEHERSEDDATVRSSLTFVIDKRETEVKRALLGFNSCSTNENSFQGHLMSARHLISHNQTNSTRIADSKDPHSQASVQRVSDKSQPRVERSVDSQMSGRQDSSAGSDSDCESAAGSIDHVGEKVANESDEVFSAVSSTSLDDPASAKVVSCKNVARNDGKVNDKDLLTAKQEKRQRLLIVRRTLSEGEDNGRSECRCKHRSAPLIPEENRRRIFPSLTNVRLQESGIATLSDTELESRENLSELELQKRYTAFSLCLCIDRLTLPRRVTMSLRQRDQAEKNLSCEVLKMQQDIQELAPLCTDRESVERVERVRHQLDMIVRCAHRVSCVAETLGAVHQESRISRAVLLADRYLHMLQSRCEKLIANVAEAKRILAENNIVIEENSGELGDDVPRIRYRSGTPANNRMMMARRRASIAAISRPMGSTQDMTKDTVRQRNSVSGRMTLRRPSCSSEAPKWEAEKLDRTESSNSMGELRGIFEQTESRRGSREENNNMLQLSHSNSQTIVNYAIVDNEIWMNAKQGTSPELVSVNENANQDSRSCTMSSQSLPLRSAPWRTMLWSIIIFFLGFFVNQAISMANVCGFSSNNWPFEHIFGKYVQIRNAAPHPM